MRAATRLSKRTQNKNRRLFRVRRSDIIAAVLSVIHGNWKGYDRLLDPAGDDRRHAILALDDDNGDYGDPTDYQPVEIVIDDM